MFPGILPQYLSSFYFNARKHLFYYLTKQMPLPLIGYPNVNNFLQGLL